MDNDLDLKNVIRGRPCANRRQPRTSLDHGEHAPPGTPHQECVPERAVRPSKLLQDLRTTARDDVCDEMQMRVLYVRSLSPCTTTKAHDGDAEHDADSTDELNMHTHLIRMQAYRCHPVEVTATSNPLNLWLLL